ncbi:hypothetical protein B0H19DRAFT_1059682 [Mycena capillaripes]|nr:hypothetical protein B0H19DRAFT_1059682 [Mycena capillaripes]
MVWKNVDGIIENKPIHIPIDIQLLSSIILGSLSLIPNNIIRYTALGTVIVFALVYNVYLNRTTWLHQLERKQSAFAQGTTSSSRRNGSGCWSEFSQSTFFATAYQYVRVKQSVSEIRWRGSETATLTWKQYWRLKRRVAECTTRVNCIRTAVELILEAELQRKLAEDITEARSALENSRAACAVCQGLPSTNQFQLFRPSSKELADEPPDSETEVMSMDNNSTLGEDSRAVKSSLFRRVKPAREKKGFEHVAHATLAC